MPMNSFISGIDSIGFIPWLWVFVLGFAVHEFEEWNILRWYQRNFAELPHSTNTSVRVWIGLVILIGVVWGTVATISGNPVLAGYIFLPAVFVVLQNALQHVYWQIFFKQYSPGFITAVFCLIPLGFYLIVQAVLWYDIPFLYAGLLSLLIIPGLVQTVQAKNRMTKQIRAIHHLGIKLTEFLKI